MLGRSLQFTLREMQQTVTSPRFWLAIGAVGLLLGLIGPFGTFGQLDLAPRLAYWLSMVVGTYLMADSSVAFMSALKSGARRGGVLAFTLYGAAAGIPVATLVWALNRFAFGSGGGIAFVPLAFYCIAITALVSALVRGFIYTSAEAGALPQFQQAGSAPIETPAAGKRPRILDRLPLEARGELAYLSMQDHYVDVRTSRGGGLVLMRLSDAIAETEGVEGMQIHRSHWVAFAAVRRSFRRSGKLLLEMNDGAELPVSRAFLQAVRAARLVT